MTIKRSSDDSPILTLARGVASVSRWVTVQWWLHWLFPNLRDRNDIPEREVVDVAATRRRAIAIDVYVLVWLAFELGALVVVSCDPAPFVLAIVQVFVVSRVIDMLRAGISTALLDQTAGRPDNLVASPPRLVLLSVINYLELVVCFGLLYGSHMTLLQGDRPAGIAGALYFSLLTQLTISFGSPLPTEWLRYLAALQGLLGLLFIAVVIARMMSGLRPLEPVEKPPTEPRSPAA